MARTRCHHLPDGTIACGPTPPSTHDLAEVGRFKRWMRGELPLPEARAYAGLSLEQAARVLNVEPAGLDAIERGVARPDDILAARMRKVYGGPA